MNDTSAPVALSHLLTGLAVVPTEWERPIAALASDSRRIEPGALFLALRGSQHHGLDFLDTAVRSGAAAVAWEPPYAKPLPTTDLPLFAVEQLSRCLGQIAGRFYDQAGTGLDLIGVTGTDGKTSTTAYLAQALHQPDSPCGLLGTLGYGVWGDLCKAGLTTPDALTIWRWLAALHSRKIRYAAMEVSSHALAQGRADGLAFQVAVLTNLSRDHLDYHGDEAAYAAAKRRLFSDLLPRYAVLNLDDPFGRRLAAELGPRAVGYSLAGARDPGLAGLVSGDDLELGPDGLRLRIASSWGSGELVSGLLGRFNGSNLLAALATLLVLGLPLPDALLRLARVHNAPGRMERLGGDGQPLAVVDYCHTPQSLEQALTALRGHTRGRLWCVFGCGGDRDPGKRPLMGRIAETLADSVIITDDNPRTENPDAIVAQIQAGLTTPAAGWVQRDRATAIRTALTAAAAGDVVLVAGKGHEDYQILGTRRLPFSDQAVVRAWLREQSI